MNQAEVSNTRPNGGRAKNDSQDKGSERSQNRGQTENRSATAPDQSSRSGQAMASDKREQDTTHENAEGFLSVEGIKHVAQEYAEGAADKLKGASEHAKDWVSHAGERVSGSVKGAGEYFQQHSPREVGRDVASILRDHPVSGVLLGIGIGIALDRLFRRGPQSYASAS